MSENIAFASAPRIADVATISAANTARDGSGTIVEICQGSAAGFRVAQIIAQATVTTTAGMIRIFLSVDGGTTWDLFDEMVVDANVVAAGVPGFRNSISYEDLILFGTNVRLGASTHNAENFRIFPVGADLT